MKLFCWTLPLLCCIFALQIEASPMPSAAVVAAEARVVIETVKAGLDTADKALTLYDRVIDRVIPWKTFNETLVELDKFRKDYSIESAEIIGEIKTFMMNGIDAYFAASQNVYEWTGLVTPLLEAYLKLFNGYNAENAAAQKKILLKVLNDGITKMQAAQDDLGKSSSAFNSAAGKLTTLQSRFEFEFDEKSEFVQSKITQTRIIAYSGGAIFGIPGVAIAAWIVEGNLVPKLLEKMENIKQFYDKLKVKVEQAFRDIDETKRILKTEIHHIGELKVQTEQTKTFIGMDEVAELKDTVTKSVHDLIAKCKAYQERHINKNDLI